MPRPQDISIIDLGTNTFHLLSVRITGRESWIPLDRERIFVNLASEGIDLISDAAMERGLEAMHRFKLRILALEINQVIAVGTAALRKASNATAFLEMVKIETGIEATVISGNREASLITKGVMSAIPGLDRPVLIMDIGGGSVELIHVVKGDILFSQSFAIGVAVLYGEFHTEEPIAAESLEKLDRSLDEILAGFLKHLSAYPDTILVGASGTFEVVESILDPNHGIDLPYSTANPADFQGIYSEIVNLNLEERLAHPEIPDSRARYNDTAVHLIKYMLKIVSQDVFYISSYAMKEGIEVEHSDI
jgi:exopolyphosphatase/guanosine-5'-triphosphate,3'-diphosphate pyrophosphatase